jgi:hypothetical protein
MRATNKSSVALWTVQAILAALFLFAGIFKLVGPAALMTKGVAIPVGLLRFVGFVETLGALGLLLPGIFKIRRELTPVAAAGLVIVMSGAVGATVAQGQAAAAIFPGLVGVLAAVVVAGRREWYAGRSAQSARRAALGFAAR